MKITHLFFSAALAGTLHAGAQKTESYTPIRSITYGGVGLFLPSSGMKTNSMIGNGVNFTFGHFQSLMKAKPMGKGTIRAGLEAKLIYSKFEKDLHPPLSVRSLKYDNGSGVAFGLSLQYETKAKKPDAFHYLIGPSVLMSWDKVFLQPSLLVGYASVAQEGFRFYDRVFPAADPANDTLINFYTAGHETNNGFVVVPGLKAGYRLHKNIAAFLSVEYSLGSVQQFSDEVYKPLPGPDPQSVYDYYQLTHGSMSDYSREGKLRALMVNFNLAFTINK